MCVHCVYVYAACFFMRNSNRLIDDYYDITTISVINCQLRRLCWRNDKLLGNFVVQYNTNEDRYTVSRDRLSGNAAASGRIR